MKSAYVRRACRHLYRCCPATSQTARRLVHCAAADGSQHAAFLSAKASLEAPKYLPALLGVFEAQGLSILDPSDRSGLHPLIIPLSQGPAPGSAEGTAADFNTIFGLLRWPLTGRSASTLSLVYTQRQAPIVNLLARNVEEYLHRLLAEEDVRQISGGPVATAIGGMAPEIYKRGSVAELGLQGKLELYTIRKVGMFMDVCEALARGHLQRDDTVSALVAAEWYMRGDNFPGWARPYEFASQILHSLERTEESRDTARVALRLPWWTLKSGYHAAVSIADLKGTPQKVKFLLSEEAQIAVASQMGSSVKMGEPKSAQVLAIEAANTLMDMVAAGEQSGWDSIRAELADLYISAGLDNVANLVRNN